MLKKAGSGVLVFLPAHVQGVRSARQHKGIPLRDKLSNFALGDAASNTSALLDLPLPQRLRPGKADFFEHSRRPIISNSSRVRMRRA